MSLINLLNFKSLGDHRGNLVAIEGNKNIPFDIRRVYYMTDMDASLPRGFHAHHKLQQVAICIKGSCKFVMDDGQNKEEVVLDDPHTGLLIDLMIWHEMYDFSSDCVLMVVASDVYDEGDYIRGYADFCQLASV
jgi:dTDP-4-dehydrorhamnose 3,5-epimerase-like enzyme